MKRSLANRSVAIAMVLLSALLASNSAALAQRNNNAANKELPMGELMKLPGKLLSEAKTAKQSGELKLTGYRVEELQLPRNINAEVRGQQVVINRAWRVTITGGPFPVRAMPAAIWIDDQIVGYGIENETLSQITAITLDNSLLREGGVIALSYGENKDARVQLPQRIQWKREGENQ
ncbi:MAG TPA: hypothetical protein VN844_26235 [Pyrinomonadaceae bacterium]|nr:hypothetical protein [Pyrinomonadaceae bacterium]